VLLPGSIFWAAAQIRAFGQIVSSTSGISPTTAMTLALFAVVAYSVLGGLLADAWTDVVQGVAVVIGLLVLSAVVAGQLGGVSASLAKVPADRWAPMSLGEGGIIGFFDGLAIPICGSIVAVELVSRVLGARSAAIGARGAVYGGVLYLLVGLLPMYLGLVGPELIKTVDNSEQIVPMLAETYLSGFFYVLFAGAIISAILSTVDTVLLASAGQVSHNILDRVRPFADDAARLARTRIVLVALAVVALAFALGAKSVRSLVETASSAGSAGVFVVLCFGLFSRLGGSAAATAAIVSGVVAWFVFGTIMELTGGYLLSVSLSALVYVAVAKVIENDVKPASAAA
jgi:Na+/proline symporter